MLIFDEILVMAHLLGRQELGRGCGRARARAQGEARQCVAVEDITRLKKLRC